MSFGILSASFCLLVRGKSDAVFFGPCGYAATFWLKTAAEAQFLLPNSHSGKLDFFQISENNSSWDNYSKIFDYLSDLVLRFKAKYLARSCLEVDFINLSSCVFAVIFKFWMNHD